MWGATDTSSRIRLLLPPAARPGGAPGQGRGSPGAPGGPGLQQGFDPGAGSATSPSPSRSVGALCTAGIGKTIPVLRAGIPGVIRDSGSEEG